MSVACSSSSGSDATTSESSDAGVPDALNGEPIDFSIKVDGAFRCSQSRARHLTVHLTRREGNPAVALTIDGLPTGVTATVAPIPPGATEGDVVVEANPDTSTAGATAALTIHATFGGFETRATTQLLVGGAPGSVDRTFGTDGVIVLPNFTSIPWTGGIIGVYALGPKAMAVVDSFGSDHSFAHAVMRLNENGSLDESFATKGVFTSTADTYFIRSAKLRADGSVVFYSFQSYTSNPMLSLTRVLGDGTADPTFVTDGIAGTKHVSPNYPPSFTSTPTDLRVGTVAGAEKLFVGGYAIKNNEPTRSNMVGRVNADFSAFDSAFDNGIPITVPSATATVNYTTTRIAPRTDGSSLSLTASGTNANAPSDFDVRGWTVDGGPIATFGDGNGSVHLAKQFDYLETYEDGSFAVAGGSDILRFGKDGKLAFTYDAAASGLVGIHPMSDGGLVAVEGGTLAKIYRFKPDGKIDLDFGSGGSAVLEIGGQTNLLDVVGVDSIGRYFVSRCTRATGDCKLARIWN